jgi:hypothetical protein
LVFLVVDYLVGLDGGAAIIDLHIADGGNGIVGVVVSDLSRLNEHRLVRRRRRLFRRWRRARREMQWVGIALLRKRELGREHEAHQA